MNLYGSYLLIFGIASVLDVTMLSFVENVMIHRDTMANFVHGLPTTEMVAVALWIIIAIIVKILINPLLKIVKKAQQGQISEEEKYLFIPTFKKIRLATYILIFTGFVIGNGAVVIIKASKGVINLGNTSAEYAATLIMIIGLCISYGIFQTFYCVDVWEVLSQSTIEKLNITKLKGEKTTLFTLKIGKIISGCSYFIGWHMLCCGYGIARFPESKLTIGDFLPGALFTLFFCAAMTTPLLIIVLKSLRSRFKATSNVVTSIRKNGDLATRLSINCFDDFGFLSDQLNKLMDTLKTTITDIKAENIKVNENALSLASDAQENLNGIMTVAGSFTDIRQKSNERDNLISDTQQNIIQLDKDAEKISNLVSSQAAAVEQNSSSITEMVANISSMSEMIKKARSVSEKLSEVSDKGNTEVETTMALTQAISEKSERMSEITKVISSVASQTNLLAMNAAIEAAHAGEAGKGFSVVADEIRKLAENTSTSTKQITTLIKDMLDVIAKSTQSMKTTSIVFNQISEGVKDSNQIVDTISNAMEEQSMGASETLKVTNEIASQINDINTLVKKQSDYNGEIRDYVDNVVNLSVDVNKSLEEANAVIREFEASMKSITNAAQKNQDSVKIVTTKLDTFKIE